MDIETYRRGKTGVEAVQFTPDNGNDLAFWCSGVQIPPMQVDFDPSTPRMLHIFSPTGVTVARHGDYVVKDPFGRFYACTKRVFEATYEPVGA